MPSETNIPLTGLLSDALQSAVREDVATQKVRLLLSEITDLSVPELFIKGDYNLSPEQLSKFQAGIIRLKANEPVQYIIGKTNFYGLTLDVDPSVLIPRPETEGLVEWLCQREKGVLRILDIGTGSGAIALAVKHLKPGFLVSATDISSPALRLARCNAEKLGLDVDFLHADLFPEKVSGFDIIVSNPPYISITDYTNLPEEIRYHEPKLALIAAQNGLEFYHRILEQAAKYLSVKGKVYLEIGEMQSAAISRIAEQSGFIKVEVKRDLTARDRYLCASL